MTGRRDIPSLYVLKLLACVLVMLIHAQPFMCEDELQIIVPLTRVGVPIFFMTSGFFICSKMSACSDRIQTHDRLKIQINKLIRIFILTTLLFLPFELIEGNSREILDNIISLKRWAYFVVMNVPFWGGHLWYLLSYIYLLFLLSIVIKHEKLGLVARNLALGGGILLVSSLLGQYQFLLGLNRLPQTITRNWFFTGIPFFQLGWMINEKKLYNRYSCKVLLSSIIIFCLLNIAEFNLLGRDGKGDLLIMTPFLAMSLFLFCLKNPGLGNQILWELGKKHTLWLYVFHVMVIKCLLDILMAYKVNFTGTFLVIFPIVFLLSYCMSAVANKVIKL